MRKWDRWVGLAGIFLLIVIPPLCRNTWMLIAFISMLLLPPLIVFFMRWLEGKFGHVRPVVSLYLLLSASWIVLGIMGLTVGPPWLSPFWVAQGVVGLAVGIALAYGRRWVYPAGAFLALLGLRTVATNGILPLISAVLSASTMLYMAYSIHGTGFGRSRHAAPVVFGIVILLMLPFPFRNPTVLKMTEAYKMNRMAKHSEEIRPLVSALNDADGLVRSEAVKHLGSIGQKRADAENGYLDTVIDALIPMIDDVETRSTAISQLATIGDTRAIRPLIQAIRKYPDMDNYPDKAVFDAFGGFAAQLMTELLEDTTGSEWQEIRARRRIILALGSYRDRRVAEIIAEHLGDESRDIRRAAVESLRRMRSGDAAEVLIPRLKGDTPRVRRSAAEALAKIVYRPALSALIEALEDEDASVRKHAAEALGRIGDERAVPSLVDALQDSDRRVRKRAVRALGNIGGDNVIDPLIGMLKDEYVRQDAVESLGKTGNERAIFLLVEALKDAQPSVRCAAAKALHQIGNPQGMSLALKVMLEDLDNPDPRVRSSAAEALGQFADRSVVPRLKRAARSDRDYQVRRMATLALAPLTNIQSKYWLMIGPFDNTDRAGFKREYPPEQEINLSGVYDGKGGKVKWVTHDEGDTSNLIPLFKPNQYVVAYALTYIISPDDREVTFRIGSDDGIKIWLNDSLAWSNDVYRAMKIDSDVFSGRLKEGRNRVLIKLMQGDREWGFHFRVTDNDGSPLDDLVYINPLEARSR